MFKHPAYSLLLTASLLCLFCGNPSKNDGPCSGPTINSCSGNICTYAHIFDAEGNFINETAAPGVGSIYWDGTDCNGDTVPCGKYVVTMHVRYNGSSQTVSNTVLMADHNGSSNSGVGYAECDSLEATCQGTYVESWGSAITSSGTLSSDERICLCCQ